MARWNRLVETVKTRKKRGKTGKKWARYGLRGVKASGSPGKLGERLSRCAFNRPRPRRLLRRRKRSRRIPEVEQREIRRELGDVDARSVLAGGGCGGHGLGKELRAVQHHGNIQPRFWIFTVVARQG